MKQGNVMFEHIHKINIGLYEWIMAKDLQRKEKSRCAREAQTRRERAYCGLLPYFWFLTSRPQGFLGFPGHLHFF